MADLFSIFLAVFLAELGDKTQLATLLFASGGNHAPLAVFFAAAGALVLSTGMAVLAGAAAQTWLAGVPLKLIAGLAFMALGAWMVVDYWRVS